MKPLQTAILLCMLSWILAGCAGSVPTPAASPSPTPPATAAPAVRETSTAKRPPAPTAEPSAAPAARGPWLVTSSGRDILVDSAETCPSLTTAERKATNPYNDLKLAGSPNGGWIAWLSSNLADGTTYYIYADLRLELTHLPDCRQRDVTSLLSADIRKQVTNPDGSGPPAAIFAVRQNLPPKWSPNGRYLAFVAALDASSADLYSYDMSDGRLRRLSNGPSHVLGAWWSPDSRWLVYQVGLPSRPHYDSELQAVYAVTPDGGAGKILYDTVPGSLGESFDGWRSDDSFVVHGAGLRPKFDVRAVSVSTGETTILSEDYTVNVAVDAESGTVALIIRADAGYSALAPGVYFISLSDGRPRALSTEDARSIQWSPPIGRFLIDTVSNGVWAVAPGGEQSTFPGETTSYGYGVAVAPDGKTIAFYDVTEPGQPAQGSRPGLRIYAPDGALRLELGTGTLVRELVFSPDGRSLAYTLADDSRTGYELLREGSDRPVHVDLPAAVRKLGWVSGEQGE